MTRHSSPVAGEWAERQGEPRRHWLHAQVASDAVLKMNDIIALLQFRKIDVRSERLVWACGDLRRRGRWTL